MGLLSNDPELKRSIDRVLHVCPGERRHFKNHHAAIDYLRFVMAEPVSFFEKTGFTGLEIEGGVYLYLPNIVRQGHALLRTESAYLASLRSTDAASLESLFLETTEVHEAHHAIVHALFGSVDPSQVPPEFAKSFWLLNETYAVAGMVAYGPDPLLAFYDAERHVGAAHESHDVAASMLVRGALDPRHARLDRTTNVAHITEESILETATSLMDWAFSRLRPLAPR